MENLLKHFKADLTQVVLDFLWSAWSQVGVMGGRVRTKALIVDPESLLLVTWEFARQDARVFDEVLEWLILNGQWINTGRLLTLLKADQVCSASVAGAVGHYMSILDKTPKWRKLAQQGARTEAVAPLPFFEREGQSLMMDAQAHDPVFRKHGWLRSHFSFRGQSQTVPFQTPASLLFKCRALFGVNIRADAYAYLIASGPATASHLSRETGYSQRRVQDALAEMHLGNGCQSRREGNRIEFFVTADKGWKYLYDAIPNSVEWFNWRAFGRAVSRLNAAIAGLKEDRLTPYIFESEFTKALDGARPDFLAASVVLPQQLESVRFIQALRESLGL